MTMVVTAAPRGGAGIALMATGSLMLPLMDLFAKLLGQGMAPLQVALARASGQALFALLVALATAQMARLRPPGRLWPHVARGLCLGGATLFFFSALRVMPMPDTLAIFFVQPMILTALAAFVLRERVCARRWAAAAAGFAGALVIIRPGWGSFGFTTLLPLAAAILFALYLMLNRYLSGQGSVLAAQFVTGLSGAVALSAVLLGCSLTQVPGASASWPAAADWPMLAALGAISFVTHCTIVGAFQRAPAAMLAPLGYLEIVSSTTLSYVAFGNVPSVATWIGIVVIVGSGLYIARQK